MTTVGLSLLTIKYCEIRHDALGPWARPVAEIWPEPVAPRRSARSQLLGPREPIDWLTGFISDRARRRLARARGRTHTLTSE